MGKNRPMGWTGRVIRIAVLSILLASVAAVGFGVYAIGLPAWQTLKDEQATFREALDESQSTYREDIKNLEQSVANQITEFDGVDLGTLNRLEARIETVASELDARQRERHTRLLQQVQNLQRQIDRLEGTDPSQWVLAEAEFNVRLASRQLRLAGDAVTAVEILKAIRDSLSQLDTVLVDDALIAIEQDIAALEAYSAPDRVALMARLSQLSESIEHLAFGTDMPDLGTAEATDNQGVAIAGSERLVNALSVFSQFFVISQVEVDSVLPLTYERQLLERQLLQLRLEQLMVALMASDAELYDTALLRFKQKLIELRDYDPSAIDGMIAALESLSIAYEFSEAPSLHRTEQALGRLKQQMTVIGLGG